MGEAAQPPELTQRRSSADREKRRVALSSVVAAVFLTTIKLVVGLATGSLGILSEAAHSGLDLVAAGVTWIAVRVSGRPADQRHPYGHGKIENLSALAETALLLVTCVWIIFEAVERLFFRQVAVEASVWSFAIMAISIVVDVSRSRALARVAARYDSQALEADALHFSTDVWSSAVVIVGLGGVALSSRPGLEWLLKADAVAALGVAAIVVWISIRLGRRTVADLMDEVPPGLRDEVFRAARVTGVAEVVRVRVRRSGPSAFADITLAVEPGTSLERAHDIASATEAAVRLVHPGSDVVVHVEPAEQVHAAHGEDIPRIVRAVAARSALAVHDVHVHEVMGARSVELHLEVDPSLSVAAAHEQASGLERYLRLAIPGAGHIVTHIEPLYTAQTRAAAPEDEVPVLEVLKDLSRQTDVHFHAHSVSVRRVDGELSVSFHCGIDADTAITDAHAFTEQVEAALRARLPQLSRVIIHVEPLKG